MTGLFSKNHPTVRRIVRWGPWLVGAWGVIAVLDAGQDYLVRTAQGEHLTWTNSLGLALPTWMVWAALTPPIVWLAGQVRIEQATWHKSVPIHAGMSVFCAILHYVILTLVAGVAGWTIPAVSSVPQFFTGRFHVYLLIYWTIVGGRHAVDYYRKYREREVRAAQLEARTSQLEARLAQAQLEALRMQLHPHFLFNTLNTIAVLVRDGRDVDAVRMLSRLSEFLRLALENVGTQQVALRHELEFLDRYLEIERIRFADRLAVRMDVEPAALEAVVPNLIMQPLVENAIKHGIAGRTDAGVVQVGAERRGGLLYLTVRDDGGGLPAAPDALMKEGIGLSNTRARLAQIYGSRYRFSLCNAPGGGALVTLAIPFRTDRLAQREAVTATTAFGSPDEVTRHAAVPEA